jgi:hypothetical protein
MTDQQLDSAPVSSTSSNEIPKISQFVLYAERSIKLGRYCHARGGDVGVRSAVAPTRDSSQSQMKVGRHATCRNVFAPSISLEIYSEIHDVWTDSLTRVQDIGIGAEHKFPTNMPALPLALAMGSGSNVTVARKSQLSMTPGTYGAVTLLYASEVWLAAGDYIFASLKMDEHSKLLADPGGVDLRIVDGLWTDKRVRIGTHRDEEAARDFMITVAGSDASAATKDGAGTDKENSVTGVPIAIIAEEAQVHALIAAPHGTVYWPIGRILKAPLRASISRFARTPTWSLRAGSRFRRRDSKARKSCKVILVFRIRALLLWRVLCLSRP